MLSTADISYSWEVKSLEIVVEENGPDEMSEFKSTVG